MRLASPGTALSTSKIGAGVRSMLARIPSCWVTKGPWMLAANRVWTIASGPRPACTPTSRESSAQARAWSETKPPTALTSCHCWWPPDGAISAFGYDGRRLRPNLVIGGVHGLEERDWQGRCLRIGEVVIGLEDLRGRCIMTTFDPDTLVHDRRVLTSIAERFGGKLALNASVIRRGLIGRGDRVELMTRDGCATMGLT